MNLLLSGLFVILFGAAAALLAGRRDRAAGVLAAATCVAGCALAIVPAASVLISGQPMTFRAPWAMPMGEFSLELDALSAVFLMAILLLSAWCAVYGVPYMQAYAGKKRLGVSWAFYNTLVAAMAMVVLARNGLLFLMAWEVMSLASFFLVTFEHEEASVRQAGWTYLVATHLGTAFLLALFLLLGQGSDMNLRDMSACSAGFKSVCFLLALVGFGTKAGLLPLHVWLPQAHPAAPSHVSAIMSGVMIKTGLYGILRTMTLLGEPQPWQGYVLVGVGLASCFLGALLAVSQRDLKRLLAYCSVENVGIIAVGMGLGVLGVAHHQATVAALGFAGALLHVLNHAIFKGLLFMGAGAALHACHTRQLDELGWLQKKMPTTGGTFFVGSAAVSGLPPLNGFVSELLIYLAALAGLISGPPGLAIAGTITLATMALAGGLAAAAFTKAFGVGFLGIARTAAAEGAHEASLGMRVPMIALAGLCLAIGVAGPLAVAGLSQAAAVAAGLPAQQMASELAAATPTLIACGSIAAGTVAMVALLAIGRRKLLAGRSVTQTETWGCGYLAPTSRIQYTGSSFAQPLVQLFRLFLGTRVQQSPPQSLFPASSSLETQTPDLFHDRVYQPAFSFVGKWMGKLHWMQQGHIQMYVLYIALTLLVLMVWQLS